MEYLWYIIAATGAGIGTGLAGLSAATVMVPILIVLCPSFQGDAGVYQATAIALASDILGSAVTAAVYTRNKKIDLKRGWIMLTCILSMSTLGSIAAWIAGHVVLGSFSLILTFCIGIRFLIKPDTQRKDTANIGAKLDIKGIAVSLFFGLTIGFGTGFVGTGGGMMMLVVFTAFLGYELKTAVGTSTFIMTFTALIASVSHIIIDPNIILQRWNVLIICSITATVTSLLSAQFANKVQNRTVGLITGSILTILGALMLCLNYLSSVEIRQIPSSLGKFCVFFIIAASALLLLRRCVKIPSELFRKLLHTIAIASILILVHTTSYWHIAVLNTILFMAIVYPALAILESIQGYSELFVERRSGEIKTSLILLFGMEAAMISICWGIFNQPYIAAAGILAWGVGDGAAALIGKRFGKHKIKWKIADNNKTWEGSLAMCMSAFVIVFAALFVYSIFPWYYCLLAAIIVAPIAAFTELVSRNGYDTVSVPIANCGMLLLLLWIL